MSLARAPRLGLQWDQSTRRALVGNAKGDAVDQPVYATFDYIFDMGKPNGKSANKREQSYLKTVMRCYKSLRVDKPGVISQTLVDKDLLVDCLKPFKNEWAQKVRQDFEIEFADWIRDYSEEKMKAGPGSAGKRSAKLLPKDTQSSEVTATVDPLQTELDFFDTAKTIDMGTMQQAAKDIQVTFKLKKAPGVEVLESMRDWRRRWNLPMRTCPDWVIFLKSIKQLPTPKPVRTGPDVAAKKRKLNTGKALQLLQWDRELEQEYDFVAGLFNA